MQTLSEQRGCWSDDKLKSYYIDQDENSALESIHKNCY
jgi:hypothetical protein